MPREPKGISVEVIDLRTVAPLDVGPILDSVHKTSRLLIAHEAVVPFGIGAEIAATVAREGFWDLDAPIERIGAAPTPPPYAPDLERAWLPGPRRHRRGDPPPGAGVRPPSPSYEAPSSAAECACDHEVLDLVRSLTDLEHLRVAVEARHR